MIDMDDEYSGLTFDWDDISFDDERVIDALNQLTDIFGMGSVWYRVSSSGNGLHVMIGEIILEVIDLCRPCRHLSEKLKKNNIIKEFLRKGGIRCQILSSSTISIGDKIKILN